jgi:serine/threonine-protein kinase RsbT
MMSELSIPVRCEADLAVALGRLSRELRAQLAPEEELVRIQTALMELARNIVKYAGRGEVRFGCLAEGRNLHCWIEAEDQGPGITDLNQAMQDHFSSGNSLGLGLPGVRRLMDRMEVRSTPGQGTWVRVERRFQR